MEYDIDFNPIGLFSEWLDRIKINFPSSVQEDGEVFVSEETDE